MLQKTLLDTDQTIIKDFTLGNGIRKEEGEGGRECYFVHYACIIWEMFNAIEKKTVLEPDRELSSTPHWLSYLIFLVASISKLNNCRWNQLKLLLDFLFLNWLILLVLYWVSCTFLLLSTLICNLSHSLRKSESPGILFFGFFWVAIFTGCKNYYNMNLAITPNIQ